MAKLDLERKARSRAGPDASKSKFKVSINGAPRKRKAVSTGDDRPRSSNSRPDKDSDRESPRRRPEHRTKVDGMKSSGELSLMTEKKWSNSRSSKKDFRSGKDFNRDSTRRRTEPRNQSSETNSSADFDLKTEKKWSNPRSSKLDFSSGKNYSRDSTRRRTEPRNQSSETKSSCDLGRKTEKKTSNPRYSKMGFESGKGSDKRTPKRGTEPGKLWSGMKNKDEQSLNAEKKKLKTKVDGKKKSDGESAMAALGERPKRKLKMGIRLDPYDTSNKRLDDSIALNETQGEEEEKKKQEYSEKVELSMNAQFRAIKPSPSILAFVQENMLGRRRDIELRRAGYNIDLPAPLDNIPFSTGTERERIEESIFRNKLEFFAAAKVSSSFPPPDAPEVAFAGRSNVGKSSLLNALTRQWGVVRTSDKPGLTQTINFFNLGPKLNMVDLPGYGFAYAKEEVKDSWEELVKEYVSTRVGLKRVCLLIDTKWGMKARDYELINLMERSETKYQVVLTKTDVVFPIDVARRAMQIEETLKANKSIVQPVMMVSSKSGAGIRSLRTVVAKLARFIKP